MARGLRPLGGTRFLEVLREEAVRAETFQDDAIAAALASDAVEAPTSQRKRVRRTKPREPAQDFEARVDAESLRQRGFRVDLDQFTLMLRPGWSGSLWVSPEQVPAVIATLRAEIEAGMLQTKDSSSSDASVWFAVRDRAWVTRVEGPGGETRTKTLCVPKFKDGTRDRLDDSDFSEKKQEMRGSLAEIRRSNPPKKSRDVCGLPRTFARRRSFLPRQRDFGLLHAAG